MKTYEIINLNNDDLLETVEANSFYTAYKVAEEISIEKNIYLKDIYVEEIKLTK